VLRKANFRTCSVRGCSFAILSLLLLPLTSVVSAQNSEKKPEAKPIPQIPAQIELLETKYRFETNGDSRKEVYARVKINNELGVEQFARLKFSYNRSFQSVEIPLVRITHPSGGTAELLPSAIVDNPDPAVVNFPAYHGVRVKSVRVLGLGPGDLLEYRVITTTTHPPLAPDFWLDHSFDRTGVVSEEHFELDVPASAKVRINPDTPATSTEKSGQNDTGRVLYRWQRTGVSEQKEDSQNSEKKNDVNEPDVTLSSFGDWGRLSLRLAEKLTPGAVSFDSLHNYEETMKELSEKPRASAVVAAKAAELTRSAQSERQKLEALYYFVSKRIVTVDLPLGSMGFAVRSADDVLSSGYATQEDKFALYSTLAHSLRLYVGAALTGYSNEKAMPRPSVFTHLIVSARTEKTSFWLDPSLEVAPFGMILSIPQDRVFVLDRDFIALCSTGNEWQPFKRKPPYPAKQIVRTNATLADDGKLMATVQYSMRGDNELLLRVAFHQTPKQKWKDVAQLLALSDGFRGHVISVEASDPYDTKEPFHVEYEVTQPKFVNWEKKPVRIPAILPLLGLPDLPSANSTAAIDLGTPLDVDLRATLKLPTGTSAHIPTGTSVARDYAEFSSNYSAQGETLTASRHLRFLKRELPADRAADYNAFVHAVQNDEAQDFTLERTEPQRPAQPPKP
jgi:Domain of Unknown Function with PDB structure (DUF3857)